MGATSAGKNDRSHYTNGTKQGGVSMFGAFIIFALLLAVGFVLMSSGM
jgi:hypothetical protein